MIYRLLYKLWKYFWVTLGSLLAIAAILILLAGIIIQLPQTKEYIRVEAVNTFNNQFEGHLEIREIRGFLPFNIEAIDGNLYAPADSINPLLSFGEAKVSIDWWELVQQNLTISSFEVSQPSIFFAKRDGQFNLTAAFQQRERDVPSSRETVESPKIFNRVNILAPYLGIIDGEITLDSSLELPDELNIPSPFSLSEVNSTLYLEVSETQIFADILEFNAPLHGTDYEFLHGQGQFYSDNQYFELNRFQIYTALGELQFSLEANPVNIFADDVGNQFRNAEYRAEINNTSLSSKFLSRFFHDFPDFEENMFLEITAQGTSEQFFIDRIQASIGQTSLLLSASLTNVLTDQFEYDLQLENFVLHPAEVQFISNTYLDSLNLVQYDISTIRGDIFGDSKSLNGDLRLRTDYGSLALDAFFEFDEQTNYEILAEIDSLDISPFFRDTTVTNVINGRLAAQGFGFNRDGNFVASVDINKSRIAGNDFEQFIGEFNYHSNRLEYSLFIQDDSSTLRGSGFYSDAADQKQLTVEGSVQNLDLIRYANVLDTDRTDLTGTFSANIQGNTIEDLFGRVSFEMDESIIGADTLRAHQLYADIDSPENESRTLRFTSTFLDGEVSGTIFPKTLARLGTHWLEYLQERIQEELFFTDEFEWISDSDAWIDDENLSADLSVSVFIKDLELLQKYLPDIPVVNSRARISATINADKDRLILSGNLFDESFNYNDIGFRNLNSALTVNLLYGSSLKEFNKINFQANSSETLYGDMKFVESFFNYSMSNDSLEIQQNLTRDDDISISSSLFGVLRPGEVELLINNLTLGSPEYNWRTEGEPLITYTDPGALTFEKFILTGDNDFLEINGTFSSNIEDSVDYTINNFDISKISDLIGGRITFSGILNGDFTTRSLGQIPSIQGSLNVDQGRLNGRIVGDLSLNSVFNADENRFDTDVRVFTNPEKYSSYLEQNNGIGHDLRFNGFFKLPDDVADDGDLFYFDADLQQIDMWIVSIIVPIVIDEMQGSSSGTGYIRGTKDDFDFDARFQISDVYGLPLFVNTGFTFNGELDFSRENGLVFHNILLTDNQGGTGTLYGDIDLDDFSPDNFLNLTLDMNNLHFMNNQYDPDVPFYANLYGTGQASITGSNFSPFLRTNTPIVLSSNSRVSIPLEEETEFDQDRRFIQFVDTFDLSLLNRRRQSEENDNETETNGEDLTFIERFTMDLQFTANNPINVQLIFDRVTNEILNANGTGQVRILLEDQDVSMFGRFNIQSGDYQFVSGDIFTRRFTLQEGGSISWQGDLVDASLNVTATYRARPTIASLLSTSSTTAPVAESGQRIPVDLVLQIGGTITAVENDFFFRVPTGIEGTLDPTISTQINNLNQNEQEKLYQATGILLSGNFLPSSDAQGVGFGEGLTGTSAVVNPLITSQVINPLLSNQINSLLRSDITFDIDLNLTAFNEVDLGVALRLFDDRVILRRDGQITGEQSDIGDIGATYRINRTFSLTAFHRQDPTLSYTSGVETRQTQEMNGMGVEAQVQFNTWKDFRQRISNAIRSIFGMERKEDEESETIAQN